MLREGALWQHQPANLCTMLDDEVVRDGQHLIDHEVGRHEEQKASIRPAGTA